MSISNDLVLIVGSLAMLTLALAMITFIYLYQRKLLKKKIEYQAIEDLLKKQELKSTYALLEGQDTERKRIAQELHDNLGSLLVALNMYSDTAIDAKDEANKNNALNKINELASKATYETRKLSHRLDSAVLKHFGLETAVNDIKSVIEDNRGIKVSNSVILEQELDGELVHNLYRIIQELANNALKYAEARHISIDVYEEANQSLNLIFKDDGIGFDVDKARNGMGIMNIKSRVSKYSGTLDIESNASGTSIHIEIPIS